MLTSLLSIERHGWLQVDFSSLLATATLLILVYLGYRAIYNRRLHSLRSFPGPFWGSITDFYNTYLLGTARGHLKMLELHDKYGSVIRISPNLLSFSDPTLLPEIYHRHVEKTPFYSTAVTGETPPLVLAQSESEHTTKVKMLNPTVRPHLGGLELSLTLPVFDEQYQAAGSHGR
ncbi:MAG: hypothetical protein Q9192_002681 [Flavoplaca navasiana]